METNVTNHGAPEASQGRLMNALNSRVSKLCEAILNDTDVEMEDAEKGSETVTPNTSQGAEGTQS